MLRATINAHAMIRRLSRKVRFSMTVNTGPHSFGCMASSMSKARVVLNVVRAMWGEWSSGAITFAGEREGMHRAFLQRLTDQLPAGFSAKRNSRPQGLTRRLSSWSLYDVLVHDGGTPIALLELSLDDTNVAHALHNGELKLLANCQGTNIVSRKPFSEVRGLLDHEVRLVQSIMTSIPVRGLFFPTNRPAGILDEVEDAIWHETREGLPQSATHFYSATLAPRRRATLRETFSALAERGLWCWFYSQVNDGRAEFCPRDDAA